MSHPKTREERIAHLHKEVKERVLILDGAMGTMIQRFKLKEEDFRGERFKDHGKDVKGNNELISLAQPDILRDIHLQYYRAGADIAETNTFGATRIAQADYQMEDLAYEMNVASARLAREAADICEKEEPGRVCYVSVRARPTHSRRDPALPSRKYLPPHAQAAHSPHTSHRRDLPSGNPPARCVWHQTCSSRRYQRLHGNIADECRAECRAG